MDAPFYTLPLSPAGFAAMIGELGRLLDGGKGYDRTSLLFLDGLDTLLTAYGECRERGSHRPLRELVAGMVRWELSHKKPNGLSELDELMGPGSN